MTDFYYKKVNKNSRKEMVDFLANHFRYFTINSRNRSTSYANNIKIYNLGIEDRNLEDKACDILYSDIDTIEFYMNLNFLIEDFTCEYGYDVSFNGRNSGYLVLYQRDYDKNGNLRTFPGRSMDDNDPKYFNDWSIDKLKERTKLIQAFDKLCDNMQDTFIHYLKHAEIVEEEEIITRTNKILNLNEDKNYGNRTF